MKAVKMRLHFQDEAPRIGCGERGCRVKIGRKWVQVTERSTGARARIPMPVFEKLRLASKKRGARHGL